MLRASRQSEVGQANADMIGGVPAEVFTRGFKGRIQGQSSLLRCETRRHAIEIKTGRPDARFSAEVKREAGKNVLTFDVCNKQSNGKRHPDIYPAKLLARSLQYFGEQHRGIDVIRGMWLASEVPGHSDNYLQYVTFLREHGWQDPTFEQRARAARQTWTGQQARSLGFTAVTAVRWVECSIQADFSRR